MYARRHNRDAGFTLLEMMLSTALFLGLSALILGGMISVVRNYRSLEIRNALEQRMRSAFELMAQEIGQAGLQASGLDVSGLVAPLASIYPVTSTGVKTVTVDKIKGIFQGASLVVNDGTNQETVVVTAMSTTAPYSITANFTKTHPAAYPPGTPVYAPGVFPGGILAPDYTASPPRYSSTRSQLMTLAMLTRLVMRWFLSGTPAHRHSPGRSSAPSGTLRPAPGPIRRHNRRTCSTT